MDSQVMKQVDRCITNPLMALTIVNIAVQAIVNTISQPTVLAIDVVFCCFICVVSVIVCALLVMLTISARRQIQELTSTKTTEPSQ